MAYLSQTSVLPDIVRDSKLHTELEDERTVHTHFISNPGRGHRQMSTTEVWTTKDKLGGGSFGQVWLQRCISGPSKGMLRAVKRIKKPEESQRLPSLDYTRELEAIAKFSHERYRDWFTQSYGWYETALEVFIAMEYLDKGDLRAYLRDPLPEIEAATIIRQLAEALYHMHRNGFAHRDMKPANILVLHHGPAWWVKVADFGISKRVDEGTAFKSIVGTPEYLSPEVIGFYSPEDDDDEANETYTFAVDIWALGQIAYQLLTSQTALKNRRDLFNYVVSGSKFPTRLLDQASVTPQGVEFITKAMDPVAKRRLTASGALIHSWLPVPPTDYEHDGIPDLGSLRMGPSTNDRVKTPATAPIVDGMPSQRINPSLRPSLIWSTLPSKDIIANSMANQDNELTLRLPNRSGTEITDTNIVNSTADQRSKLALQSHLPQTDKPLENNGRFAGNSTDPHPIVPLELDGFDCPFIYGWSFLVPRGKAYKAMFPEWDNKGSPEMIFYFGEHNQSWDPLPRTLRPVETDRHALAWASQTGEGLLIYSRDGNRTHPHGFIALDEAEITYAGKSGVGFKCDNKKHSLTRPDNGESDWWNLQLTKQIARAREISKEVVNSPNYKMNLRIMSGHQEPPPGRPWYTEGGPAAIMKLLPS